MRRTNLRESLLIQQHGALQFDVVHVRAVENGLRNQQQSLTTFAHILRPGGLLLLGSVGMWLYGEDKELLPCVDESDPQWSALGSLFHHFQQLLMYVIRRSFQGSILTAP